MAPFLAVVPPLPTICAIRKTSRLTTLPLAAVRFQAKEIDLLDKFWESRGVREVQQRQELIQIAEENQTPRKIKQDEILSGIAFVWNKTKLKPQISGISQSLLTLYQVLGENEKVIWMCLKEPKLLTMDASQLIRRLLQMKLALSGNHADILKLVEEQPALLTTHSDNIDKLESPQLQLSAWEHGLLSDNSKHWEKKFTLLNQFYAEHGHSHVGYLETDNSSLVLWCQKQRYDASNGCLSEYRRHRLLEVQFEFNDEEAEWLGWFHELQEQPLSCPTSGLSFLLSNWCAIQRISKKSGHLSAQRVSKLEEIGFDWSAPDPLS